MKYIVDSKINKIQNKQIPTEFCISLFLYDPHPTSTFKTGCTLSKSLSRWGWLYQVLLAYDQMDPSLEYYCCGKLIERVISDEAYLTHEEIDSERQLSMKVEKVWHKGTTHCSFASQMSKVSKLDGTCR